LLTIQKTRFIPLDNLAHKGVPNRSNGRKTRQCSASHF
jgi:hypothetical protein